MSINNTQQQEKNFIHTFFDFVELRHETDSNDVVGKIPNMIGEFIASIEDMIYTQYSKLYCFWQHGYDNTENIIGLEASLLADISNITEVI